MFKRDLAFLISAPALLAVVLTGTRAASRDHYVSMAPRHEQPSDLRIRFDDRDALMRSERRTVTNSEAPTLEIRPHANGGVQIVGWERDTYSVTACEAAGGSGDAAERILSQIRNLRVHTENGPITVAVTGNTWSGKGLSAEA